MIESKIGYPTSKTAEFTPAQIAALDQLKAKTTENKIGGSSDGASSEAVTPYFDLNKSISH